MVSGKAFWSCSLLKKSWAIFIVVFVIVSKKVEWILSIFLKQWFHSSAWWDCYCHWRNESQSEIRKTFAIPYKCVCTGTRVHLNWISAYIKYTTNDLPTTHKKSHSVLYEYNIVTQNINMHHRYTQNMYCHHRTNFWQYHGICVHAMPHHHLIDMDNILWRCRKKCLITLCAFYLTNNGYKIDSTLICQGVSAISLKKLRWTKKFAIFLWEKLFFF